jgi:hypothetical protein
VAEHGEHGEQRRSATPTAAASTADVAAELRSAVTNVVEPAIALLRDNENIRGNSEMCFSSAAGKHLRFRCCVYFTALAAGLLEHTFAGELSGEYHRSQLPSTPYGALARWLLQPPTMATPSHVALADRLVAAADVAADYGVDSVRSAAAQLPGPVGRYAAPLVVRGVRGTLWRCEMTTAHTYLLFEAPGIEDIYIDVTFKQFLVLPEWMETRHFEVCQADGLFSEHEDSFVGTAKELEALMTLPALEAALRDVYARAGGGVPSHLLQPGTLQQLHTLRNDALYVLSDTRRRRQMCGKPAQALHEARIG